ncbi:hypothetical protein BGZ75_006328 [Mortierella antarctica]|nr:hypothetical protein BGZ75_006328 [Mortierella antarctica]
MIPCFAGTGSGNFDSLPLTDASEDIVALWDVLSKKSRIMPSRRPDKLYLEDYLTNLVPDGSSRMESVPCSAYREAVASWKLDSIISTSVNTTISNMINLACGTSDLAYGFVYRPTILCFASGAISKLSLFFAAKLVDGEQREARSLDSIGTPEPTVDIGYIYVNTTAYIRTNETFADNVIEKGLSDYHARWALDHIPSMDVECVEASDDPISNRFPEIDSDKKNHHTTQKFQYISHTHGVIPLLGKFLDNCFANSNSNYTVQHWRDCQAWTHDFNARPTILECESSHSESSLTSSSSDCPNVMTNTSYIQAIVLPRANKTLDVHIMVNHTSSFFPECDKSTYIDALSSRGTCIRFSVVDPEDSFQPKMFLDDWSQNHHNNIQLMMSRTWSFEDDPARSITCNARTTFMPRDRPTPPPRAVRRHLAVRNANAGNLEKSSKSTVSSTDVPDLYKDIAKTIVTFAEDFQNTIKIFKNNITITKQKVDCLRFSRVDTKIIAHHYTGLNKTYLEKVSDIILNNIKPPKKPANLMSDKPANLMSDDQSMVDIGLKGSQRYSWQASEQMYRQNDGSQVYFLILKNENEDGTVDLVYARLTARSGLAQDEIIVNDHGSILGGFMTWHTQYIERSDHKLKPMEVLILQKFWTYLCLQVIGTELHIKAPAVPDLTQLCPKT